MARARKRMLAAVPTATVVVTNPTHYAIALAYDRGAKAESAARGGEGEWTRWQPASGRWRASNACRWWPTRRWPARCYAVEVDAEIPAEHFKVVAEIIAYVWRLRGRAGCPRESCRTRRSVRTGPAAVGAGRGGRKPPAPSAY